jgi:hypothetical protein
MDAEELCHNVSTDRPLKLTFGNPLAMHVTALVAAEGSITWRPKLDFEFNSDTRESEPCTAHERIEEDWKVSPDEAEGTFELRNGEQVLASHHFPALTPACSPAEEALMGERWAEVWAFADAHGIEMNVHRDFCDQCLDIELGHEPTPMRRLQTPAQTQGHQISA